MEQLRSERKPSVVPGQPDHAAVQNTEAYKSGVDLCVTETRKFLRRHGDDGTTAMDQYVRAMRATPGLELPAYTSPVKDLLRQPFGAIVPPSPAIVAATSASDTVNKWDNVCATAGVLLDLRTRASDADQQPDNTSADAAVVAAAAATDATAELQAGGRPPARPDVLEKIRRKIFERRHQQQRVRCGVRPDGFNRALDCWDDGYDSDEAQCVWRPW